MFEPQSRSRQLVPAAGQFGDYGTDCVGVSLCHAMCDRSLSLVAGGAPGGEEPAGGAQEEGAVQAGSHQVRPGSGSLGSPHCRCAVVSQREHQVTASLDRHKGS